MASGINSRDTTLPQVLRSIFDRLARVERPATLHIGPISISGSTPGFTLSVNSDGNLVATSDAGTVTIVALP